MWTEIQYFVHATTFGWFQATTLKIKVDIFFALSALFERRYILISDIRHLLQDSVIIKHNVWCYLKITFHFVDPTERVISLKIKLTLFPLYRNKL